MPVTKIGSRWVSGELEFYEKASPANPAILAIGVAGITATLGFPSGPGDDVALEFGNDSDVTATWVSASSILQISPLANDTGSVNIGDGTTDVDFKVFLGSGKYVLFDVGDSAVKVVGVDIDLSASGTGVYDLILKDSVADALSIRRASTDMMVFDSSTPQITITPKVSITGDLVLAADIDLSASGTGTYDLILKDGVADALSIRRAATDMIVFNSTTPLITITPATTVTGKLTANGSIDVVSAGVIAGLGTGANGIILKNLKTQAATTLSGTTLDVEVDVNGTPYYFKIYPTSTP